MFDRSRAFTIGLEEELLLVDRSHALSPIAPELLASMADPARFHPELSPAQIEIVSGVHLRTGDAVGDLARGRRFVIEALNGEARLVGLAAHPICDRLATVSPGDRYASIEERFRWAARQAGLAGGLHIHLGVPGADRLLAVYNALRGYMPEVAALAASAPFFAGRDSGLASIRPMLAGALPRQGVAPAFTSWDAFAALLDWGTRTKAFNDHTELWWECRLHPGFGTIEVRVSDTQSAIGDVEALATLVHLLARSLAARHDAGVALPVHDSFAISENRWRAATDGVEGALIDLERLRAAPAGERIAILLDQISAHVSTDDEARAVEHARRRLGDPHPRRQRAVVARAGLPSLISHVADATEDVCVSGDRAG